MKKIIALLSLIALTSCGFNGNQKFETNDSEQRVVQDGSSFTYVVIRLEFIEQIKQVCADAHPLEDYPSESQRAKVVAECTLENMSVLDLDLGQISDFSNDYCGDDVDLSELTAEQLANIEEACALLEGV